MDINTLVAEQSDYLYAFALAKTGDAELSKDLVQDTFVAALKNMERFRGEAHVRTWLTSILRNKVADHYRAVQRRGRKLDLPDEEDRYFENLMWRREQAPQAWDEAVDTEALMQYLHTCLELLPERLQAVLRRKYLEGVATEDILVELELTAQNFWVLLHRSRLKMRQCVEQQKSRS